MKDFWCSFFCAKRLSLFVLGVLLLTAIVFSVAGVSFIVRVHRAPLDIAFAKPYVERGLSDFDAERSVVFDRIMLHWPDLEGPLLLGLEGVKVLDADHKVLFSVDQVAVSFFKRHLFLGQFYLKHLVLKNPFLRVIRTAEGGIDFGFGKGSTQTGEQDAQRSVAEQILDYISTPESQNTVRSPLAKLKTFQVQDAQVMVEDHVLGVSWFLPDVDARFNHSSEGAVSDVRIDFPDVQGRKSFVQGHGVLNWADQTIALGVETQNFDSRILAGKIPELGLVLRNQDVILDAKVRANLDEDLRLLDVTAEISSDQGQVRYEGAYNEALAYKDLQLKGKYDAQQGLFDLSQAHVVLNDVAIDASAQLTQSANLIEGPVHVAVDEVQQSQIEPLWPEFLRGDNAEKWVVQRLSEGVFRNASTDMNLMAIKGESGWALETKDVVAAFDFEGMSIDYRAPMVPVQKAKGHGSFDGTQEKLQINIEDAYIADLHVKKADLEFVQIMVKGQGEADINVQLEGPVSEVLSYVSKEPIGLPHKFDLKKVSGQADLSVNVDFPTVKGVKASQVNVNVKGTAKALKLPALVGPLDLTDGALDLSVKEGTFRAKGTGRLGGEAVRADYEAFLKTDGKPYKARAKAKLVATQALREKLGVDLSIFMSGDAPVDVVYTAHDKGRSEVDVQADLSPARFYMEPFDYEKMPGQAGQASLKVILDQGHLTEIADLKGTAPKFSLDKGSLYFRSNNGEAELVRGQAGLFVVDETVGKIQFEKTSQGRMKVILSGQVLDLRPFLASENKDEKEVYDAPPMLISVNVDKMITSDGELVDYGKIYADIDNEGRFNQLEMDAVAGKGDLYLRYKPDDTGARNFRFEADDAGAALKAFGLYKNIIGGKMVVYAEPLRGVFHRNLIGRAEITDFKVMKAPGLAKLLGAMSLKGLNESLQGQEGLSFTKLEAGFDWLYRKNGSLLVLKEGRTSGNALGLTFDGTFDKSTGLVDVEGTIVPLSGINNVIGSIPIIGDILTGGTGALIAATYKMKGKNGDLKTEVNPLSVLTPGILRRILFE